MDFNSEVNKAFNKGMAPYTNAKDMIFLNAKQAPETEKVKSNAKEDFER